MFEDAVTPSNGMSIVSVNVRNDTMYCCGPVDTYNNTCTISTKGIKSPSSIPAGLVIYNRTSGSPSPNNAGIVSATTTVTATATVTASNSSSTPTAPSPRNDIAIAAEISGFLGLGLLIAVGMLKKEGKLKRNLKKTCGPGKKDTQR